MTRLFKLDRLFLKIIKTLQREGRLTNAALAEEIGLSPSPCLERVRKLESCGVIAGYHADIDLDCIAPNVQVFCEVTLENHHPEDFRRFASAINEIAEVVSAFKVSGPFDFALTMVCRDIRHYHDLSEHMINSDIGIDKFIGHVVLERTKRFKGYPLDELVGDLSD